MLFNGFKNNKTEIEKFTEHTCVSNSAAFTASEMMSYRDPAVKFKHLKN